MSLRNHEETQHAFSCVKNISVLMCETCNSVAKTKRKLQNDEVIHHTVEDEN